MPFRNIFKPLAPKSPARLVANVEDMNFIRNFINDLSGLGCRVVIPKNQQGRGARIIIGDGSDIDLPDDWPTNGGDTVIHPVFPAEITNSASTWAFTEQKQTGAGLSDETSPITGTAIEMNGIAAPASGSYTFKALVFKYVDGSTARYSFQMPIPGDGTNRDILETDVNGMPNFGYARGKT